MTWIEKCFSRMLVDNHITDQLPMCMSRYDPRIYVEMMRLSGMESAMVYACDHNGNCTYPTEVGHQHGNLKGRDIFGEVVAGLRQAGIAPVAYYTVIYHNDSAFRFPECAVTDSNGVNHAGRYHFCCPNHPQVVAFYKSQIREILAYDIDGLFIDMTFWPMVCTCPACREGYLKETGRALPETIDWNDERWVSFQRFRERSMVAFAQSLTDFVRSVRPDITVTHQFSPVLHGWRLGQSTGIAEASDYASGDFYQGKMQQRMGLKVFEAFSSRSPFEFMTSCSVNLRDHTSRKSDDELFIHALTTLAHGGAYLFIDAINPDGTLQPELYHRLGAINRRLRPYRELIERVVPRLTAPVGVYYSIKACVDPALNGIALKNLDSAVSNMELRNNETNDEILGIVENLQAMRIPYVMVCERQVDLSDLKVLICPNTNYLSEAECQRIRDFVSRGGTLIATGDCALAAEDGHQTGNFQLADVFGVNYAGRHTGACSYLHDSHGNLCCTRPSPLATVATARVLAQVNLPEFTVNDSDHYVSIHSNPPGQTTDYVAASVNDYGQGRCFWFHSEILGVRKHDHQTYARAFFRQHLPTVIQNAVNLPTSAELTLLKSSEDETLILTVMNYQDELPNIPLHDVAISLSLPEGVLIRQVTCASTGKGADYQIEGKTLTIRIPKLFDGEFFELKG